MFFTDPISSLKYFGFFFSAIYLIRWFCNGPKTNATRDMTHKIAIITGCSAGIGKETARDLLDKGAKVIFACRDKVKTLRIIDALVNEKNRSNAIFMQLNLANFKSMNSFVQEFSKKFDRLDLLINNAGVFNDKLFITEDGIENTLQTNHISHFTLTGLLLKYLKNSDDPRVINVGSEAHAWAGDGIEYFKFNDATYKMFISYGISKAANIYFSEFLTEYSKKNNKLSQMKAVTVHPGGVNTEISRTKGKGIMIKLIMGFFRPFMYLFFKDEKMGAQTTLHCCYIDRAELVEGGYYANCKVSKKNENIRKYGLENKVNLFTFESVLNSKIFEDSKQEELFKDYLEFLQKKLI